MRRSLKIIFYIIIFILGFLTCILLKKYTSFTIANQISIELNPFDIVSLIVTLLIAVYVGRILTKQNEYETSEKELIVKYFTDFKDLLRNKIEFIIEKNIIEDKIINCELKILRSKLNSIISIAEEYDFIRDQNNGKANQVKEKLKDIWEILTDPSIAPVDNNLLLRKTQVATNSLQIEKLLFDLIIEIYKK
ncbi:hypothetical protein [Leptospira terpstrae]|uniref:Uncharacterized protein n=1 Tax=Leptospira terpstrae serovar Hualin str. LT 11-33 = ATCC 700639 TaxID=1257025 RepID=N1VUH5_9LEPT|nr:hypothetical protein [Leptospira terpstrae]EMY60665.1 hypothetical protein LEP1GSC203_0320 [Leptospira terpstrae serovar Hualin str. LT 11-33 = ATCC 700639]